MALFKRSPRKTVKITAVAKELGVAVQTAKNIAAREGWNTFRYSDAATAPIYVYERDVIEFRERRERMAA